MLKWTLKNTSLERAMGIEPTALAWEARVLPLYDARLMHHFTAFAWALCVAAMIIKVA